MDEFNRKMQIIEDNQVWDKLLKKVARLDKRIERDLYKLLDLIQNPDKVSKMSTPEIVNLLKTHFQQLQTFWRSFHAVFSSYNKICEPGFSLFESARPKPDKQSSKKHS